VQNCCMSILLTNKRTTKFQRNIALEKLLLGLNCDLQPSENLMLERYKGMEMSWPLILIMGPLRSGTTLFMQWLANTGLVAYPSNLLSRFYQAPVLGAKIQQLLTDPRYNFRDELGEFVQRSAYQSENGKTKGVLAPNEFWYFWRRFLADPKHDVWSDDELRQTIDVLTMTAELVGIMDVFEKPFAAKGMLFNYNISFLDSIFDKVLFVQMIRDPVANVASVLKARKRQFGNVESWYSFEIPEYDELKHFEPISQVSAQVACINRAVTKGLEQVASERKITVVYEEFCQDPAKVHAQLINRLGHFMDIPEGSGSDYSFHASFKTDSLSKEQIGLILETYKEYI